MLSKKQNIIDFIDNKTNDFASNKEREKQILNEGLTLKNGKVIRTIEDYVRDLAPLLKKDIRPAKNINQISEAFDRNLRKSVSEENLRLLISRSELEVIRRLLPLELAEKVLHAKNMVLQKNENILKVAVNFAEAYSEIVVHHEFGAMDGGCYMFAAALCKNNPELDIYSLSDDNGISQHFVAVYKGEETEEGLSLGDFGFIVDYDGVHNSVDEAKEYYVSTLLPEGADVNSLHFLSSKNKNYSIDKEVVRDPETIEALSNIFYEDITEALVDISGVIGSVQGICFEDEIKKTLKEREDMIYVHTIGSTLEAEEDPETSNIAPNPNR